MLFYHFTVLSQHNFVTRCFVQCYLVAEPIYPDSILNISTFFFIIRKQFPSVQNSPVVPPSIPAWQMSSAASDNNDEQDGEERKEDLEELGSGSGSSEPEHGMKTSESSLEIM